MSAPNSRLISAAKAGTIAEVQKLLNTAGVNVNHAEWNGDCAVLAASKFGHDEVVALLIEKGADSNSKDKKGESALMQACGSGHWSVAQRLLGGGAEVNHKSKVGYTALMVAVLNGHIEIAKGLLLAGADLTIANNEGKRAVDFAKSAELTALLVPYSGQVPEQAESTSAEESPEPILNHTAPTTEEKELKSESTPISIQLPTPAEVTRDPAQQYDQNESQSASTAPFTPMKGSPVRRRISATSTKSTDGPAPMPESVTDESAASEADSQPQSKVETVTELLIKLIDHSDPVNHPTSRLPYHTLHLRFRDLRPHYHELLAASILHGQECVLEYYALQLEPILIDATTHVVPYARRSLMGIVGPSDRAKLALFHEIDTDVTRILKDLCQALEDLKISALTQAMVALPKVGPVPFYEMQVDKRRGSVGEAAGSAMRSSLALETEDPRSPLLHQPRSPMMDNLHSLLGGRSADGRLSMFNLNRPTVETQRRAPARRKFQAEGDGYTHLLPSYAELTARLSASVPDTVKHMFGTSDAPHTPTERPPRTGYVHMDSSSHIVDNSQSSSERTQTDAAPSSPLSNVPSRSPSQEPVKTTPKKFADSVFSKLGSFDPTKVKPPGVRPSVTVTSVQSDATGASSLGHPGMVKKEDSVHSPLAVEEDAVPLPSAQLGRATNTTKTRRAPTKKKFEQPTGETPPTLVVVPIAPVAPPTAAAAPAVQKTTAMGALKALFTTRRPSVAPAAPTTSATSTTPAATAAPASTALTVETTTGAVAMCMPAVLQEGAEESQAAPLTPKTPGAGGITTMLSSLFSGKNKPKTAQTQSAAVEGSSLSDNLGMLNNILQRRPSKLGGEGPTGGGAINDALRGGVVIVQNVAIVAEKLPIIGSAAILMLQLIDLCDAYRCNKRLFLCLKARMQFMYTLYFAEGGIAEIAHKRGKDSIMEPFARHLEILILDAINYLSAFTSKGFFHKLMSGRRPQQRFAEIDQDITKCLNGLTTALQLLQVSEVSAAMEQLQLHTRQNQHLYEAVADVQRKVDRFGGLHGVRSMNHEQLLKFSEDLGVRDVSELREEISECQLRFEGGVDRVTEDVRDVKSAVARDDPLFQELRDEVAVLGSTKGGASSGIDLSKWRLTEAPVIDRKQLLGTGAFGSVYSGTYRGQPAAFKVPNTNTSLFSSSNFPELQREVKLHLKVCGCPGVVKILAVSLQRDEITADPCVVMERAIGSVHDYLHKQKHRGMFLPVINLSLTSKLTLALQVASAMEYISAAGLIHRDIKSSNVLLFYQSESTTTSAADADVCAKICDFGLSKNTNLDNTIDMSSNLSVKGTPSYLSPEAFNVQYSTASDVYAYGILLNELLTEQLPLPAGTTGNAAPTIFQLRDAVCRDGKRPELFSEEGVVGDALRPLIKHCWCQQPEDRCTFAQVTVELSVILHTALSIAKYGSDAASPSSTSARATDAYSTFSPLPLPHAPSPITPPLSPAVASPTSSSAATTAEEVTTTTYTAVDAAVVPSTTHSAASPDAARSLPSPSRSLDTLSVDDVGQLMDHIHMHALRDVLVAHKVSGMMLQCCDTVEDLLCPEFGLQSRGLAGGLMKKIQEWREHGVSF